jgi:hypothetical protein
MSQSNIFLADLESTIPDLESNLDTGSKAGSHPADHAADDKRGPLLTVEAVRRYALAGKSRLTIVSNKTKARFTFQISAPKPDANGRVDDVFFVALLSGPDNTKDYRYVGRISRGIFWAGAKVMKPSYVSPEAPSSKGFAYVWRAIMRGDMPADCTIWHESNCGRCGRALTVPSSVSQGFGPECANKIGLA